MQQSIHVERGDVEPIIRATFPEYQGKKIQIRAAEEVVLRDLNWSGGTRNRYTGCSLETGRRTGGAEAGNMAPPWDNPMEGKEVPMLPGLALVEWCMFCGKDLGLTIFVHPSMLPKFLPANGEELPEEEKIVLFCLRSLISSYRREEAKRHGVSESRYNAILETLKGKGLVSRVGGLTTAGKNAASGLRL